ncbi:hypothetical protein [Legionella worsleiensis]|uniref:Uncharacterized protein n=1 Tax=Legionella worsleiensis TaxID=45076 RepID=A0A0W1AIT0_9GAMM|nr:hypothetical protein [Legionella worsleiensis]KTD81271.1 hypothetical protein Lwor_0772 [Legionella worsleiensis]STY30859.1 Uncharacterised protein [Legionella worsleiensis]
MGRNKSRNMNSLANRNKSERTRLENAISKLENCNSYQELQSLLPSVNKAQRSPKSTTSPETPVNYSPDHDQKMNELRSRINLLIAEKKRAFPKPRSVISTEQQLVNPMQGEENPPVEQHLDNPMQSEESLNVDVHPLSNNDKGPFIGERVKETKAVINCINQLHLKIKELAIRGPSNRNAIDAAKSIVATLQSYRLNYITGKMTLNEFKNQSITLLNDENKDVKELKTHRGLKNILANLLIALTGIGAVVIAARSVYHGKVTLFNTSTDSGSKVDAIKESLENLSVNQAPSK